MTTTTQPIFDINNFQTWTNCGGADDIFDNLVECALTPDGANTLFRRYRWVEAIMGGHTLNEVGIITVDDETFERWVAAGVTNYRASAVFASAAERLTRLPDTFETTDDGWEIGWHEIVRFIGTLSEPAQHAAAMGVELSTEAGVWLAAQTIQRLFETADGSAQIMLALELLDRVINAMRPMNAGKIFAWVANATQSKNVFEEHPLSGTVVESKLMERLRDCGWDVVEVLPSEHWGRRGQHTPLRARMFESNRHVITWVHSGPRVNVQPGMFVALPTTWKSDMCRRSKHRDGSVTTIDVDFSPYMLYRPDRVRSESMTTVVKFHVVAVENTEKVSNRYYILVSVRLINENGIPVIVINGCTNETTLRGLNLREFKHRVALEVGHGQRIKPSGRSIMMSLYDFVTADSDTDITGYIVNRLLHAHLTSNGQHRSMDTDRHRTGIDDLKKLDASTVVLRFNGSAGAVASVQDGVMNAFTTTIHLY